MSYNKNRNAPSDVRSAMIKVAETERWKREQKEKFIKSRINHSLNGRNLGVTNCK